MSVLDKMKETLGGESYEAVRFDSIGDGVRGTLISVPKELTDVETKFGKKDAFVVNLLLADGVTKRTLWMWVDSPALGAAFMKAVAEAGVSEFKVGDTLTVEHHATKPTDKGNDQKLYRAKYEPVVPGSSASVSSIFGQGATEEAY